MKHRRSGDKTIIHWKNVPKATAFLLIAGICVSVIPLTGIADFVFGVLAGIFAMVFCIKYFDLWHFES